MKCPCHKCEHREIGCHSNCAAYLDYKEALPKTSGKDIAMAEAYFVHKNSFRRKKGKIIRKK